MPTEKDVGKAYRNYYTHENENTGRAKKPDSIVRRFKYSFTAARRKGYLALKYDTRGDASALDRLAGLLAYLNPALKSGLDFSAMYIKVRPGAKLLEIGCGSGHQLEFLRQLGWQVEGLDLDPTAVEIASSRGLAIHLGSLKEQKFPDRSFDAVVSSHVIEHVHDPTGLLAECRRILRPDGKLVIITPNTASWGHAWFRSNWLHLDPPRHLHLFNPTSLRRAAKDAGLTVSSLTTTVREADGLFRASHDIQRTNRHVWGSRHSWPVHKLSKAWQLAEWLLLKAGLDRGEELMMICER
jgi:2-polyprenyl-3-methyl-5-hydroxy-6-metoxy-1,4-benzoquinol methylase